MDSRMKQHLSAALAAVLAFLAPGMVRADLEIQLSEDGGPATTVFMSPPGSPPQSGGFLGTFMDFSVNISVSDSQKSTSSHLLSAVADFTNNASSTHTLHITVSQNNYSLPGSSGSTLTLDSQVNPTEGFDEFGPGQQLVFQSYANNSNMLLDTSGSTPGPQTIDLNTLTPGSSDKMTTFARTTSMYSLTTTSAVTVVAGGTGTYSANTSLITSVPAPGGLVLALTALPALGIGGWLSRRRKLAAS
jgi:hypothetical protein